MQTKHPKTETPETYTYCGITAPLALWLAVGLETINWIDGTVEFPRRTYKAATDAELIEARIQSGDAGEVALVWLIGERRRQREEDARNTALFEQGRAQSKAGDDAIHAARIHRQAEELKWKAMGIKVPS